MGRRAIVLGVAAVTVVNMADALVIKLNIVISVLSKPHSLCPKRNMLRTGTVHLRGLLLHVLRIHEVC